MKKISIILAVLFLIPLVSAKLELEEIRAYINLDDNDEIRISHMEDEDEIELHRGDDLMIKVYLDNNMDNKTKYYLWGRIYDIDDGQDITKRQPSGSGEWRDIDADDSEIRTLSFDIPIDTDYDNYRFDFYIYYKYANGTEDEFEYDNWDVIVKKEKEKEEIEL